MKVKLCRNRPIQGNRYEHQKIEIELDFEKDDWLMEDALYLIHSIIAAYLGIIVPDIHRAEFLYKEYFGEDASFASLRGA